MSLNNHGTPVVNSRQWAYALSPNSAGNGWNFITAAYNYQSTDPVEWVVLKNLTTSPTKIIYNTPTKIYPNSLAVPNSGRVSTRAPNGRIIFPQFLNYFAVYDPTTEAITQIGPFVESPPINPNASTIPYSWCFDSGGMMYLATQESENRPSCVVSLDTNTLATTVLGYVGDSSTAGTTYGYYCVADTATAKKFVYVAFGQAPWQLWCVDITPGPTYGTATKLYSDPAISFISFQEIVGRGYIASIQLNGGSSGVTVWCLDGATYPYTPGVAPPGGLARSVTPASNPLIGAPQIDASTGIGLVGWRPNGSTGAYTYVPYTVNHMVPIPIESLVDTTDGILGNAQQYNGFFQNKPAGLTWFGAATGIVSGGPRLRIDNKVYIAGYPNGALFAYDLTQPWQASVSNPAALGAFAPNTTLSGMKYANCLAWSPHTGRLYCNGDQERSRLGMGVGWYDVVHGTFGGTYLLPGMNQYNTTGLVVDDRVDQVVSAVTPLSGTGDAALLCCNRALTTVVKRVPLPGVASLGAIYPTSTPGVVAFVAQHGATPTAYQYDVVSGSLLKSRTLATSGTVTAATTHPDGSVWMLWLNGTSRLIRLDPNTLDVTSGVDVSDAAPVTLMTFAADASTMFIAGGSTGANLYSTTAYTPPTTPTFIKPPSRNATRQTYARLLRRSRYP